ncbi:MAG: ParB/RepB/Spo0J family partition protein, partial [Armatimonadetes bacterium]|nr:ParB/RepB/Spo0J family partition protein [Armatimonadota bacterium]
MRSNKFRIGLDKLATPPVTENAPSSPATAALASALDLNEGVNRLAEAREIALDQIHPNPHQPRQTFHEESLEALAASIREQGVLQPITVTPDGDGYRIVAGERRWRAAQLAGLSRIPALVRNLSDRDQRIVALMENLQREDLNDIDRARGLADLREALAAHATELSSHELDEEVGKRLGISGRSVRNFLALLNLP